MANLPRKIRGKIISGFLQTTKEVFWTTQENLNLDLLLKKIIKIVPRDTIQRGMTYLLTPTHAHWEGFLCSHSVLGGRTDIWIQLLVWCFMPIQSNIVFITDCNLLNGIPNSMTFIKYSIILLISCNLNLKFIIS